MASEKSNVGEVHLKNVRLSFPALFEPEVMQGSDGKAKPRYKANFLIDKSTPHGEANHKAIIAAIKAVRVEKWGEDYPKLKPNQLAYRDGNEENWDGYEGHWYVSANSPETRPPLVIDRNRSRLSAKSGRPYAGCYVNAIVRFWAQDDKEFGKRVNCSLEGVQFFKDGEAFGAPQISEDRFESFDDDSDFDADEPSSGGKSRHRDEDDDLV